MAGGAMAAGIFSLGCVPPEAVPEVPALAAPAPGVLPVEVSQQPDGRLLLGGPEAPVPGTQHDYMVVGGGLTAPLEGSLDGSGAALPALPDGQYTVSVTATDGSTLTGTGTAGFTVTDGRVTA